MSVAITLPGGDYGAVIVSGANLGFDPARVVFPDGCRALVLQNEVPHAANLALAGRARAAGIPVIWNAAPFRNGPVAADVTVVNRGEAAALVGTAAPVEMARAIEARLGGRAVVTLGGDGVATAGAVWPARRVAVVSTHGAGDMFTGALAARLAGGAGLDAAVAFAQGAAALHVSLPVAARAGMSAAMVEQTPP
jgi:ribokinase